MSDDGLEQVAANIQALRSKAAAFDLGFFANTASPDDVAPLPDVLTLPALQLMVPVATAVPDIATGDLVATSSTRASTDSAVSVATRSSGFLTAPSLVSASSTTASAAPVPLLLVSTGALAAQTSFSVVKSASSTPLLNEATRSAALASRASSSPAATPVVTTAPTVMNLSAAVTSQASSTASLASALTATPTASPRSPFDALTSNSTSSGLPTTASRGPSIVLIVGLVGGLVLAAILGYGIFWWCRQLSRARNTGKSAHDGTHSTDGDSETLERSIYGGALAERIGSGIRKVGASGRSYTIGRLRAPSMSRSARVATTTYEHPPVPPLPPLPPASSTPRDARRRTERQTQTTLDSSYSQSERYSVPIHFGSFVESYHASEQETPVRRAPILSPVRDEFPVEPFVPHDNSGRPGKSTPLKALWDDESDESIVLPRDFSKSRFSSDTYSRDPKKKFVMPFPRSLKLPKRATTLRQRPPTALQNAATTADRADRFLPIGLKAGLAEAAQTRPADSTTAQNDGGTIARYFRRMVGGGV